MQIAREYSGTLTDVGEMTSRNVVWGDNVTDTAYWNKCDFVNQTIAAFLSECGVDAAYEKRSGDTGKWLYIYNIPFLYYFKRSGSYNYRYFCIPKSRIGVSRIIMYFSDYSDGGEYHFKLYFAGSPEAGFLFRIKGYGMTGGLNSEYLILMPCKNVITGGPAVAWSFYSYGAIGSSSASAAAYNTNALDVLNGAPDFTYYSESTVGVYNTYVRSVTEKMQAGSRGRFPLFPVFIGLYQLDKVYCGLSNFDIPDAVGFTSSETMTEFTVGGRTFLNLGFSASTGGGTVAPGIFDVTQ